MVAEATRAEKQGERIHATSGLERVDELDLICI
jgi:hypothetical protein